MFGEWGYQSPIVTRASSLKGQVGLAQDVGLKDVNSLGLPSLPGPHCCAPNLEYERYWTYRYPRKE